MWPHILPSNRYFEVKSEIVRARPKVDNILLGWIRRDIIVSEEKLNRKCANKDIGLIRGWRPCCMCLRVKAGVKSFWGIKVKLLIGLDKVVTK